MLFSDMKCFACGNPPGKTELSAEEKCGLTGFDSLKGGLLESKPYEGYTIHICDSCLIEGGRKGYVTHTITQPRPPNNYEYTWNPDGDDKPYHNPPPVFLFRPVNTEKES